MTADLKFAAQSLSAWFQDMLKLCQASIFSLSDDPIRQGISTQNILIRNAKILIQSPVDLEGNLYQPTCLVLAAACSRLAIAPNLGHWISALENVVTIKKQIQKNSGEMVGLSFGTPASIFKQQMDDSIIAAGLTDQPTSLNEKNQNIALGMVVNWGLKFLIAYANECRIEKNPAKSTTKNLSWIKQVTHSLLLQ